MELAASVTATASAWAHKPAGADGREPSSEAHGSYSTGTSFTPKEPGSWSVRSEQEASREYQASTSEVCRFSVFVQPFE